MHSTNGSLMYVYFCMVNIFVKATYNWYNGRRVRGIVTQLCCFRSRGEQVEPNDAARHHILLYSISWRDNDRYSETPNAIRYEQLAITGRINRRPWSNSSESNVPERLSIEIRTLWNSFIIRNNNKNNSNDNTSKLMFRHDRFFT